MERMKSKKLFFSERGLVIEYGDRIDPVIFGKVRLMASAIREKKISGVVNLVPTFRSLLVMYEPTALSIESLTAVIDEIEENLKDSEPTPGRYFELPTFYGAPYDYDTERIADHTGLEKGEVVRIFSESTLLVYMLGFVAALPYIGDLPGCLHTPRLPSPRVKLPAGVVGVGGQQVAVLPVELPSGFNYFGRCFHKLYDPNRFPPSPFVAGDRVRFKSVPCKEAEACRGQFPKPIE